MLDRKGYLDYCTRFNTLWRYLKSLSIPKDDVISEICSLRNYQIDRMYSILEEAEFIRVGEGLIDTSKFTNIEDFGLLTDHGVFLLEGRYIFPVKDMLGNVLALIGWFPDEKKYITTPSKFFSKECLFYGMEQLSRTGIGKTYFLVEGIFDVLSIRSLGFNCVGQMGIVTSKYKKSLYGLFKRVIGIPDNDSGGSGIVADDKWKIPSNGSYIYWRKPLQGIPLKDVDDLCLVCEKIDLVELFSAELNNRKRLIEWDW